MNIIQYYGICYQPHSGCQLPLPQGFQHGVLGVHQNAKLHTIIEGVVFSEWLDFLGCRRWHARHNSVNWGQAFMQLHFFHQDQPVKELTDKYSLCRTKNPIRWIWSSTIWPKIGVPHTSATYFLIKHLILVLFPFCSYNKLHSSEKAFAGFWSMAAGIWVHLATSELEKVNVLEKVFQVISAGLSSGICAGNISSCLHWAHFVGAICPQTPGCIVYTILKSQNNFLLLLNFKPFY